MKGVLGNPFRLPIIAESTCSLDLLQKRLQISRPGSLSAYEHWRLFARITASKYALVGLYRHERRSREPISTPHHRRIYLLPRFTSKETADISPRVSECI